MEKKSFILGAIAFTYYTMLCAKEWTWVFLSSDSGDWLMTSNWFAVPQPYGSPLYILLMRLIGLFPGDTAIWATILLSCLPSAITVMFVYLIVHKLTDSERIAIVSATVLIGSAVFLTQSTVLEEYALTTMLLTLGTYFYISERKHWTAVCLGLAMTIHVFVLGVILFLLILEWRKYLRPLLVISVPIVALFYSYILLLMYLDTPRLFAGALNVPSLIQYLTVTSGAVLGQLSLFEAPKRLLLTARILLMSFGLALIPLATSIQRPIAKSTALLLGIVIWTLWYQITCLDPASWTFITLVSPSIAILVGMGLTRLNKYHLAAVLASACILILVNSTFLNAHQLAKDEPLAADYYDSLQELPDGSVVVVHTGSYSMGLFYVMSEGKDLVPAVYPYLEEWDFDDHYRWLLRRYDKYFNEDSNLTIEPTVLHTVSANLGEVDVYFANAPWSPSGLRRCFTLEDTKWLQIKRIECLTGLKPEPYTK